MTPLDRYAVVAFFGFPLTAALTALIAIRLRRASRLVNQLLAAADNQHAEHRALIRANRADVHDLNVLRDAWLVAYNAQPYIPRQRSN